MLRKVVYIYFNRGSGSKISGKVKLIVPGGRQGWTREISGGFLPAPKLSREGPVDNGRMSEKAKNRMNRMSVGSKNLERRFTCEC